jgi:hypothetical protein
VNKSEETVLVWSLFDAAKPILSAEERQWLCVQIGAGDQTEAINFLSTHLTRHEVAISDELLKPLWAWASGYLGSDSEQRLRTLLTRLGVPPQSAAPAPELTPRRAPFEERPRRVRHGFARTSSVTRTQHPDPAVLAHAMKGSGVQTNGSALSIASAERAARQRRSIAETNRAGESLT